MTMLAALKLVTTSIVLVCAPHEIHQNISYIREKSSDQSNELSLNALQRTYVLPHISHLGITASLFAVRHSSTLGRNRVSLPS